MADVFDIFVTPTNKMKIRRRKMVEAVLVIMLEDFADSSGIFLRSILLDMIYVDIIDIIN